MSLTKILLKEIGDSKTHYRFSKISEYDGDDESLNVEYEFNTPENKYTVYFEKFNDESLVRVGFDSKRGGGKKKVVEPTDEHVTLKVMSTVMHIAKAFNKDYSQYKTFKIKFPWFDKMSNQKRKRIYEYFIEKYFPDVEIKKVFRDLIVQL